MPLIIYLVQILFVICEKSVKCKKPYAFLNFQCRRKTCIKNNLLDCLWWSRNRSTMVLMQNVFLGLYSLNTERVTHREHWSRHRKHPYKRSRRDLEYFKSQPNLSPRQTRWWEYLSCFNYNTIHVDGTQNQVADCKISYILLLIDIYARHIYLCFI